MSLRDSSRMSGSVQDLVRLDALSDDPNKVLFVSDRTLYLLANFAGDDVYRLDRYAKEFIGGDWFFSVDPEDSTEVELVNDIANNFGLEVVPVGAYQPPWMSSAYRAASTQTIPNNTFTKVDFDTLEDDTHSAFSLSTNGVIVASDGYYQAIGRVAWAGSSTGIRTLSLYVNGTEFISTQMGSGTTGSLVQQISHSRLFDADDNIELYCRQNTGGDLNLTLFLAAMNNSLSVYRLG